MRISWILLLFLLLVIYFEAGETVDDGERTWLYNGCFSKDNLDKALNYATSKVVRLEGNLKKIEDCSDTCQGFDLIGIQYQLCLCIQLSDETAQLFRISDQCCNVETNNTTHFRGLGAFSLYCWASEQHKCRFGFENYTKLHGSNECEIFSENQREAQYNTMENFNPNKTENSNNVLRFNKNGEVCQDLETSNRNISRAMQLFNEYIPDLTSKPHFCQKSCEILKKPSQNNFSVVSKFQLSNLVDIGWCQCLSNLSNFQSQNIQICSTCPTDLKSSGLVCTSENVNYEVFCK